MKTATSSVLTAGGMRNQCVMMILLIHSALHTVQGYAFVVPRSTGSYCKGRRLASSATTATSSRKIGLTPAIYHDTNTRFCTSRNQYYRCRMSSVSPEASPPSSINGTQTKQPQEQHHSIATIRNQSSLSSASKSSTKQDYTTKTFEQDHQIWDRFCDFDVPEGRVVGLALKDFSEDNPESLEPNNTQNNRTHWIHSVLHPDEVTYAATELLSSKARRETFVIGRVAIREALKRLGSGDTDAVVGSSEKHQTIEGKGDRDDQHHWMQTQSIPPILKDEYGRPTMPKGYLGSISHKDRAGVGIVALDASFGSPGDPPKFGIGIDLERTTNSRRNIARRVLTEHEIESLGQLEDVTEEEEVMLRFSLKECIYKAVHPLICQYVGFQEAEVTPHANGTATVEWMLKSGAQLRLDNITAHWQKLDGGEFFLSSSSAALLEDATKNRVELSRVELD